VVDQFLVSGLAKWGQTSRLTLLLPTAMRARGRALERTARALLQLAAEGNIRVANCTTPAQYFHLLRRQALVPKPRPLIVMTPKSLLRLPAASSRLEDLSENGFQPVIDDAELSGPREDVTRLVLCTGKIYYDLPATRSARRQATSPSAAWSCSTRSPPTSCGRSSRATPRCGRSSGCRRSRRTWARARS